MESLPLLFPQGELSTLTWQDIKVWAVTSGLKILLILALAWLLLRAVRGGLDRFERHVQRTAGPEGFEHAKRTKTLSDMLQNVASFAIVIIATLTVLQELRVNIMPILTGAGILGLAVGFGAQTLVKDVISGFFMIVENQVRVGDVASINGTGGLVEAINLRTIVLRDQSGTVHIFPCGTITTLSNLTKDYAYAVLDVTVPYRYDTDEVVTVMKDTAEHLRQSPVFGPMTLEPIEIIGIDRMTETSVTILARIKTPPLKQWDVAREYRRRLKKALMNAHFDAPLPANAITVRQQIPAQTATPPPPSPPPPATEGGG